MKNNSFIGTRRLQESSHPKETLENLWLNTKDVAKLIGVTTRTIQNYRDQGMLPFSQIGRVIRYRASDIQDFLMQYYVQPSKYGRTEI
jgi:excisionase family DNA binding protein